MRQSVRLVSLLGMLLFAAVSVVAATPGDFYLSLLRRGVSAFDSERYPEATEHLKIAAFGLVDSIEHYQTAQVYLALAYDRQDNVEKARDAARRVVAAERIERRFATLRIPAGVASSFDSVARKLLTNAETAFLARASGSSTTTSPSATTTAQIHSPPSTQPRPAPQKSSTAVAAQNDRGTQPEKKPPTDTPAEKRAERPSDKTDTQQIVTEAKSIEKPAPQQTAEPKPAEKTPQQAIDTKPIVQPPVDTKPAPKTVERTPQQSASDKATSTVSKPQPTAPSPTSTTASVPPQEVAARLAAGERALIQSELPEARRVYRSLLDAPGISRDTLIRVGEGLYRSRDFEGALASFAKIGTLRRGEEPYHYYVAVAYYETGRYNEAKTALAAALPFIEITPDVVRYRAKIDGAIQ